MTAAYFTAESNSLDNTSAMSYQQRLAAFNSEMAELVRKYFPEV